MNVAQISFFLDPNARSPRQLLKDWHSLTKIAGAVAEDGHRVTVIQASQHREQFELEGVQYCFLPPSTGAAGLANSAEFLSFMAALNADVAHVHGLGFGAAVSELRSRMPHIPILLQDHADRVPRVWRARHWRRGFIAADGVSFCARAQAEPFVAARLLPRDRKVFEIPECTSDFTPGDRAAARQTTGLHGDPCVLSVGHLDFNKDPLTVLAGISEVAERLPGISLWCCFGNDSLRAAMEERIDGDLRLRGRVHLLGRVPHEQVELLMRSADIYVSASRREGSGYALIESMACGLPAVVSDIPAFRVLLGHGSAGRLFTPTDAAGLADALVECAAMPRNEIRNAVRSHFDAHVSRAAIGASFAAAYRQLIAGKAPSDHAVGGARA
jgi:glycosyltransferase involved in cell wall biosynthesis